MVDSRQGQELYHEIFGSVLDRSELTPYLLRDCSGYDDALERASLMLVNRGFSMTAGSLDSGELDRAALYVRMALGYLKGSLLPSVASQLRRLISLASPSADEYARSLASVQEIGDILFRGDLSALIDEDPRHLFLLASGAKYPHVFRGRSGGPDRIPPKWRSASCSLLKLCHLAKALEEDSQDIFDFAQLGMFFGSRGISLTGLFGFAWDDPENEPTDEHARCAYMKLAAFFRRLSLSVARDAASRSLVFNSGDGVSVEIVDVKARLKSPESMIAKIGKDASEEAFGIRDVLAVTFLLKKREDSLILFHALQKQGVILQENIASSSVTQTLFDSPADMEDSVRALMHALALREGRDEEPDALAVRENATGFYGALNSNSAGNPHTSGLHRKFQCKLNFSVPVLHDALTGKIVAHGFSGTTRVRQHTVPVELRISDIRSWERSELRGEAHHAAYKFRQHLVLLNRLFSPLFSFPADSFERLRADQDILFR